MQEEGNSENTGTPATVPTTEGMPIPCRNWRAVGEQEMVEK
jgi:hypothetical protein